MKKQSKLLFLALTLFLMLAVLSAAIAAPILCRPFYYIHVKLLNLPAQTPWSYEEICAAYNEMLDFCIFGTPFGTGKLRWSEEGRSHFADCAVLFRLDFVVLAVSLTALLFCLILCRRGISPVRPLNRGPAFWGSGLLILLFLTVAAVAGTNFDAAFVVFHQIFFPGKDNWLFDPQEDQIINILPQEFFRNCAVLIVALIVLACVLLMIWDRHIRKKRVSMHL